MGFRPFICRLAAEHGLNGEVDNRTNGVTVIVQGEIDAINRFRNDIFEKAPPASHIKSIELIPRNNLNYNQFVISKSKSADEQITEISPDIAVCPDCLAEMSADGGRKDYPFINCTNCGPRFTIIESLPYDRPGTTMKEFPMCEKCSSEYSNILDRRYHAQPIACNSCGPQYLYRDPEKTITGTENILGEISKMISSGRTVAIKGIGGYFLMCDALNEEAVRELRVRKQRDSKPFAVMFSDIMAVRKYCHVTPEEEAGLKSWRRPILILREKNKLAGSVSNGLSTIGAMLPYMPFHYLLFRAVQTPAVVLTSGNISEEPIVIEDETAERDLVKVAHSVVSYNRRIHNRADDSVIRFINKDFTIIRRSRGYAPGPVDLSFNAEGILALGPEQKNTFCIGRNCQAILSQHIGDLKNAAAYDFYTEAIERFSLLFRFRPEYLACDLHPDYFSSAYASELSARLKIPVVRVQHHHAHIASCMAEHGLDEKIIGISLDGTGYGTDGNIWGGEFMTADMMHFTRFAHFDYVPLPGGDKAVDEPWRMAFSYLYKYFGDTVDYGSLPFLRPYNKKIILIREMIMNGINCPPTSSAGRLFDAVSAILNLCTVSSFDSEAPMRLESSINADADSCYRFALEGDRIIFADMFSDILQDLDKTDVSVIAARFHNTIAEVIVNISEEIRKMTEISSVVLSGGVFQNRYLLERSVKRLSDRNFKIFTNSQVPSNDGGVSLGQLAVASKTFGLCV